MTEEIVQQVPETEIKPSIKKIGSNSVISYQLPNFHALTGAVRQVTEILRSIAPRFEFITLKKEVVIKVESGSGDHSGFKIHFVIPRDLKKSLESVAQANDDSEDTAKEEVDTKSEA